MPHCCGIDKTDARMALEVVRLVPNGGHPADHAVRGRALEVLEKYLDMVLAPPADGGDDAPADSMLERVFSDPGSASPEAVADAGELVDDSRWFFGKNLRLVREARRRAAKELELDGFAPEVAARRAAAVSPATILALILQYGPDLLRVVRAVASLLKS